MPESPNVYIRFLHAVSDAPGVDIYVNEQLVTQNLRYREFTDYFQAYAGHYTVTIYPTGNKETPVYDEKIELYDDMIYTVAVAGLLRDLNVVIVTDQKRNIDKSKAYIRFINLSPYDTEFDVYLNDRMVFDNLFYQEVSPYIQLMPGTYYVTLKDSKTGQTKFQDPRMTLKAGKLYAGYFVGVEDVADGLQILIPLEKASY